ncbi:beta-glucosidase M [Microthyrium microscopicum]|uniref:beta-glucosidase n=1 Tax=Microthyrium microscopicum TaxID=703497 RepID=A0A6A6TZ71_9PEZI|nr:beta-glucosidase M [Microthyrium microscopicum]
MRIHHALRWVPLWAAPTVLAAKPWNSTNEATGEGDDWTSPIVAPPIHSATGPWATSLTRAANIISKMTNPQKAALALPHSTSLLAMIPGMGATGCSGISGSGSLETSGYHGMCLTDGPAGVRGTEGVSGFPAGLHIGATWNKLLAHDIATAMGLEFKRKGVHVALGPVAGPLGRVVKGGRNWEGFSVDPYLSGKMVGEYVAGMQRSVIACVKHFVGNEQETHRNPSGLVSAVSSDVDDRTMHEVYLWPFQDAVRAGVGSVMCSYNKINNTYGCENSKVLNGLLKTELGFRGFVVSDWGAQHSGLNSAVNGLDMVMPDAGGWRADALVTGITNGTGNGTFTQARLDDMATRILATYYQLKLDVPDFPAPGAGMPASLTKPHTFVDARDPKYRKTIFQAAVEGHVLVKNVNNALPLKSPKLLSLFGYDAYAPLENNPSDGVIGKWAIGMESVGGDLTSLASILTGAPQPSSANNGTLISGGGSGSITGPYYSTPHHAFEQQAWEDGTYLHWDFKSIAPAVNAASEACIVFINEFAGEGSDRTTLADKDSDTLVKNVAGRCRNTMVVVHNAGVRLVDAWIENVNVTAVIYAHLPGQDSGRALVEVMYGKQAPSGRLPYTVAKKEEDYGELLNPSVARVLSNSPQSIFKEGSSIDYRHFIEKKIVPRYPFGYGLTYTTFNYTSLEISTNVKTISRLSTTALNSTATEPLPPGGDPSLFDVLVEVTCSVTNSGKVAAAAVPQLYVGIPNAAKWQLRGFDKMVIEPGRTQSFKFPLTRRDLSVWNTVVQQWEVQKGSYSISVGDNVEDLQVQKTLEVEY